MEALREEVSFARVPGAQLAVTELKRAGGPGLGPAFLLLHGFAQNRLAYTLGPLPGLLLDRGARVFLGELRGHGLSVHEGPRSWSLRTHLEEDLPALIAHVKAMCSAGLYLAGHSMGGMLGYALLSRRPPIEGLITFGAPLLLGRGRPLVRLASVLARPVMRSWAHREVPMDRALALLARPLCAPEARGTRRALQQITRLASPAHAAPEQMERILRSADPESNQVFRELMRMSTTRRRMLAGIELEQSVAQSPLPVVAVVGQKDIFAPLASVAPLQGRQAGPRLIIAVQGTHVDLTMGYHLTGTVEKIWRFAVRVQSGLDNG